jgi:hypothetical protein
MSDRRNEILADLRSNVLEVTFTKVNGQERQMRCTLMPDFLPPSYRNNLDEQKSEKEYHQTNPDVIACWDIGSNGWRSFRIDSVIYTQVIDAY